MTMKTTTERTLYIHVVLNGAIFPQIWFDIVPYAWDFKKLSLQLPKNVTWIEV